MRVRGPGGGRTPWLSALFVAGAAAGIVGGLAFLKSRGPRPSLDPRRLRERIRGLPGGREVGIRIMGKGIVELVGDAPSAEAARLLLNEVRSAPGVDVVVNRLWTPSSREGAVSRTG